MAEKNKKKMTRGKILSVFAVMLMLATAFAGIFIISFSDDDSSAYATSGSGTKSDPYTFIDIGAHSGGSILDSSFVLVGSSITLTNDDYDDIDYIVNDVTSGHGLTVNYQGVSGTLTGTAGQTVTITVDWVDYGGDSGTYYHTFTIAAAVTNYTVTINAGTGGSVSKSSVSVPSGTSISTSGNTLTIGSNTITATANSGYSFSSWSNASGTVTANRTITANFVSSGYTVSFNGNGGSTPSSLSGTSITLPSSSRSSQTTGSGGSTDTYTWTTTTSYTFAGWYTSATGGSYVGSSGSSYTPTGNTTLYAHWNESSSTSYTYYYKIIYNANGGSGAPSTYTTSSSSSSASIMISGSTPSWSNHTFKGWATSSTAVFPDYYKSTAYTFSYGTTTLYAVWHQTATVQFNANGGSGAPSSMSDTGAMGSSYSFLIPATTPTKSGYQFKGWATSSTATEPEYSTEAYITVQYGSTATLYAVWGLTTYYSKLFYNANGGTGAPATDTMSSQYSSQPSAANHYVSTTVPTWTNHTFLGWATSSTATTATYHANDTITVAYSTSSSAGTTLYAVWKSNTVTLSQPSQQYGVAGSSVSLSPVATADPSGATITYTATNVPSNLTVQINGSQVIMLSDAVGTYQFTLTAGATNYESSSRTVTVEFVPQLVFENDPSAGQLAD